MNDATQIALIPHEAGRGCKMSSQKQTPDDPSKCSPGKEGIVNASAVIFKKKNGYVIEGYYADPKALCWKKGTQAEVTPSGTSHPNMYFDKCAE